jgi:hypothetical protein
LGSDNILIIIIIITHQSDLDIPLSPSSNSIFEVLPSYLRPFGLQFSTILAILLLSILVTCRSQFDLIPKKFQQDDTLVQYFIIPCKQLYMFRVKHSPIIRSSIELYLQHLVVTNSMRPAVVVDESEFDLYLLSLSSTGSTFSCYKIF